MVEGQREQRPGSMLETIIQGLGVKGRDGGSEQGKTKDNALDQYQIEPIDEK